MERPGDDWFEPCGIQVLVPALRCGDIAIMNSLSSDKRATVERIELAGALLRFLSPYSLPPSFPVPRYRGLVHRSPRYRARGKNPRPVRMAAIAPSLPMSSHVGAIAVRMISAPSANSSERRIQEAKRIQISLRDRVHAFPRAKRTITRTQVSPPPISTVSTTTPSSASAEKAAKLSSQSSMLHLGRNSALFASVQTPIFR